MDFLLAISAFVACVALCKGSRAALALLASLVIALILREHDMAIPAPVMVIVDLAVIAWILLGALALADWIIVGSFVPAWAIYYFADMDDRFLTPVVAGQMLLTLPIPGLQRMNGSVSHGSIKTGRLEKTNGGA